MKRVIAAVLCFLFLSGCAKESEIGRAVKLRERILSAESCTFSAKITADYGEKIYTFGMQCSFDQIGSMTFTVTEPDSISGVTGKINADEGFLTFDEQVLAFELLADGQVTPVSAPWLFMKSLRGGYIHSCGQQGETCRITIDDSYDEAAMQIEIWVNEEDVPIRTEILWQNRRVLSVSIESFLIL